MLLAEKKLWFLGLCPRSSSWPACWQSAAQSYYQRIFDEYDTGLKSYYEEVKVSGPLADGIGFAEVALIPKQGGQALTSTAKYINIMKREADGTWKTTHDIWNGNEMTNK